MRLYQLEKGTQSAEIPLQLIVYYFLDFNKMVGDSSRISSSRAEAVFCVSDTTEPVTSRWNSAYVSREVSGYVLMFWDRLLAVMSSVRAVCVWCIVCVVWRDVSVVLHTGSTYVFMNLFIMSWILDV